MKTYMTSGICARSIDFDIVDGKVRNVKFNGGCAGNAQGIAALVDGMDVKQAVAKLAGIQCRMGTSCPDQLAKALVESDSADKP